MKTQACVSCGFCCTQRPCHMGTWDEDRKCCTLLTDPDDKLVRRCMIYRSIVKQEAGEKYPMMGSGCSSSMFNDVRDARIAKMEEKE
jgi:hypothetical protein